MSEAARILVWADEGQQEVVRAGIEESGLQLVGIGSSDGDAAKKLADGLGVDPVEDLRQSILREDIDVLWLAGRGLLEREERRLIRDRKSGSRRFIAISSEPRPGLVSEVIRDPQEGRTAQFAPLMRRGPGFQQGLGLLQGLAEFGAIRMISISVRRRPEEGSLFACLYDAMDLLGAVGGKVNAVDASYSGTAGQSRSPDLPADLSGGMTLHLRLSDGVGATVGASNQEGKWFRGATIMGEGGCLRLTDSASEWRGPEGELNDSYDHPDPLTPGVLAGMQLGRILEDLDEPEPPADVSSLLAICEAARLSCRTGQGESPGKVLEMLRGP